ncbi:MAG TPA: VCBS repeat-containing protein, partial [Pyrinomonadaceae bacterium]|nr:VCBS repeat-containing protein [Pyrinomonadaceae bacterium]
MKRIITAICLVLGVAAGVWAQCGASCSLFPPGLRYPLIDWRFVNGGSLPQTYAVFMKEDTITIKVESGGRLSLGPDDIEIVLTSSVNWKKELTAFSFCNGRGQTIWTHDSNRGPVSMRLHRSNCSGDTVVLRKEKFLQGMVDMYHLDPFRFWNLWAGKIITINWNSDFDFGSFPPACSFPCVPTITRSDAGLLYDTDGKADIAVFRPNSTSADWFVVNTSTGISFSRQLGRSGDRPLPYDYDGDGRTDMAVWRRETGEWIVTNSLTGQTRVVQWGVDGDMPVPGDFDGDGKADLATFHPATGTWFIKGYITGAESSRAGGSTTDLQVAADY